MIRSLRALAPVLLGLVSGVAMGASPFSMEIDPTFEGYVPQYSTAPVTVLLRNSGPDAHGTLHVSGGNFSMDYPVDLPRGAEKRILTYPKDVISGVDYTLLTDHGSLHKDFSLNTGYGDVGSSVSLYIGDTAGQMAFIRAPQGSKASAPAPGAVPGMPNTGRAQDAYVSPANAPDRPVGYSGIASIVLGSGAERLNDEQVHALKVYVLTGGTLAFVGGASSPILSDARWQGVLPAHDFHVTTLNRSETLSELGGIEAPQVSVLTGTLIPNAFGHSDGNTLIAADRGYGLGKVVYFAFNPFEPPLSHWEGRRSAVTRLLRPVDTVRSNQFLGYYSNENVTPESGFVSGSSHHDPFSTEMPPTERVFYTLGAYFIVVVPLNFLILRRLRKGELAWITAPIISLGFAGAFFFSAKDLYSAEMSTASSGVLVVQEGMEDGVFVGRSQIFIPRGGNYDFKLSGVDRLGVEDPNGEYPYYSGYGRQRDTSSFNPIDSGEIRIPNMHASNLDFREISYRQQVPTGGWFSSTVQRRSDGAQIVTFKNGSPYNIVNARFVWGTTPIGVAPVDVPSGSQKSVVIAKGVEQQVLDPRQNYPGTMQPILARGARIGMLGTMLGFRPGPQLGTQVDNRTVIHLAYFASPAGATP